MNLAIGMIETKGLIASVEALDAMLKAAEVHLVERTFVRGGLVCITVNGDVAAVAASVDAGSAAVDKLGAGLLLSRHVIARPDKELAQLFTPPGNEPNEAIAETVVESDIEVSEDVQAPIAVIEEVKVEKPSKARVEKLPKETKGDASVEGKIVVDELFSTQGVKAALEHIMKMRVVAIRNLARQYSDFQIQGREISRANKKELLAYFEQYYRNKA